MHEQPATSEPTTMNGVRWLLALFLTSGLLAVPQRALADEERGARLDYVERIEISGNQKTRDRVIRRELEVYEGELLGDGSLESSRRRVTALGLFEWVEVSQRRGSADDRVVVTVRVEERPTGLVETVLDFSSLESALLTAQVGQINLFGRGQTASLATEFSSRCATVGLSFVDPHLLDTNWIWTLHYSRQECEYGPVWNSNAGDLGFGYHLTPELTLHLGYGLRVEDVAPGRPSGGTDILLASSARNGLASSLVLTLTWDQRDNRLFPTAGNYQSVSLEYSPEWLGGSFQYFRLDANTRWYVPLFWGMVFTAQGSLGYVDELEGLPSSKRVPFLHPTHTLHDYPLSHGPTGSVLSGPSPDAPIIPIPLSANKHLLFNFEVVFPILARAGLRGVVFYDAGNQWSKAQDFFGSQPNAGPLNLAHSVGLGVRWFSPIGPVRFEWGIPLTRQPGDEPFLFQLALGAAF